jgi:hypothetical protein
MAKVAAEYQTAHIVVFRRERSHYICRAVFAAVIHKEDFVQDATVAEGVRQLADKDWKILLFIARWNHYPEIHVRPAIACGHEPLLFGAICLKKT